MGNLSAHLLHVILKMKSINFPWGNFCKVGLNVSYVLGERCLNCLYVIKSKLAQKLYYSNAEAESRQAESSRHEKLWAGETMQRSQKASGACPAESSPPKGAESSGTRAGQGVPAPQPVPGRCGKTSENWSHPRITAGGMGKSRVKAEKHLRLFLVPKMAHWQLAQVFLHYATVCGAHLS